MMDIPLRDEPINYGNVNKLLNRVERLYKVGVAVHGHELIIEIPKGANAQFECDRLKKSIISAFSVSHEIYENKDEE